MVFETIRYLGIIQEKEINMARKTITDSAYTQLNTVAATYLAQNLSDSKVFIAVAATLPAVTTAHDFVLRGYDAISANDVEGLLWAKVEVGTPDIQMSIVE